MSDTAFGFVVGVMFVITAVIVVDYIIPDEALSNNSNQCESVEIKE